MLSALSPGTVSGRTSLCSSPWRSLCLFSQFLLLLIWDSLNVSYVFKSSFAEDRERDVGRTGVGKDQVRAKKRALVTARGRSLGRSLWEVPPGRTPLRRTLTGRWAECADRHRREPGWPGWCTVSRCPSQQTPQDPPCAGSASHLVHGRSSTNEHCTGYSKPGDEGRFKNIDVFTDFRGRER